MPKYLTVEDLTKELGISRTAAYQVARQIRHSKVGRRILIAEEDLLTYLAQNTQFQQDSTKTQ